MWFKQAQIFQLTESIRYTNEQLTEILEPLAFQPCSPSMTSTMGWTSCVDEEGTPLVRSINGYIMLRLQIEEKILPATVIRQELDNKIKQIQIAEDRKVRSKEKMDLKDELILTLLPRAFSKLTCIYGYIDTKNQWLVLGTTNPKKTESFLSLFKKSISEQVHSFKLKRLSPILTHWLKHKSYPTSLAIEKACVLSDPEQKSRIIRCQQQDLFAGGIQSLIKDGCEAKQIALCWQDHVNFTLLDDFSIRGLQFEDEIIAQAKELEAETKQQQFDADLLIMTEALSNLLKDLLELFIAEDETEDAASVKQQKATKQTA